MKVSICFQEQRKVEALIYELWIKGELWAVGKTVLISKTNANRSLSSDQNEEQHLS